MFNKFLPTALFLFGIAVGVSTVVAQDPLPPSLLAGSVPFHPVEFRVIDESDAGSDGGTPDGGANERHLIYMYNPSNPAEEINPPRTDPGSDNIMALIENQWTRNIEKGGGQ